MRNTLDRDTKLSPSESIFGRPIRDFTPILPGNDFINITDQNVKSETLEMISQEVVITARPNEDTSDDTSAFEFILFKGNNHHTVS